MYVVKCKTCGMDNDVHDLLNVGTSDVEYNDLVPIGLITYTDADLAYDCRCRGCKSYIRIHLNFHLAGIEAYDDKSDEMEIKTV